MKNVISFILKIIWIIDILDISFLINGVDIAQFLDVTVPINTLAWILLWICI